VGTCGYMASEQARGRVEELDARADVFGLGAVLCEVLTGLPPYAGVPASELHLMAAGGDLADAFARLDRCGADAELIALARDCLARERDGRPRDAGAVAERLAAYLAEGPGRLRRGGGGEEGGAAPGGGAPGAGGGGAGQGAGRAAGATADRRAVGGGAVGGGVAGSRRALAPAAAGRGGAAGGGAATGGERGGGAGDPLSPGRPLR